MVREVQHRHLLAAMVLRLIPRDPFAFESQLHAGIESRDRLEDAHAIAVADGHEDVAVILDVALDVGVDVGITMQHVVDAHAQTIVPVAVDVVGLANVDGGIDLDDIALSAPCFDALLEGEPALALRRFALPRRFIVLDEFRERWKLAECHH